MKKIIKNKIEYRTVGFWITLLLITALASINGFKAGGIFYELTESLAISLGFSLMGLGIVAALIFLPRGGYRLAAHALSAILTVWLVASKTDGLLDSVEIKKQQITVAEGEAKLADVNIGNAPEPDAVMTLQRKLSGLKNKPAYNSAEHKTNMTIVQAVQSSRGWSRDYYLKKYASDFAEIAAIEQQIIQARKSAISSDEAKNTSDKLKADAEKLARMQEIEQMTENVGWIINITGGEMAAWVTIIVLTLAAAFIYEFLVSGLISKFALEKAPKPSDNAGQEPDRKPDAKPDAPQKAPDEEETAPAPSEVETGDKKSGLSELITSAPNVFNLDLLTGQRKREEKNTEKTAPEINVDKFMLSLSNAQVQTLCADYLPTKEKRREQIITGIGLVCKLYSEGEPLTVTTTMQRLFNEGIDGEKGEGGKCITGSRVVSKDALARTGDESSIIPILKAIGFAVPDGKSQVWADKKAIADSIKMLEAA